MKIEAAWRPAQLCQGLLRALRTGVGFSNGNGPGQLDRSHCSGMGPKSESGWDSKRLTTMMMESSLRHFGVKQNRAMAKWGKCRDHKDHRGVGDAGGRSHAVTWKRREWLLPASLGSQEKHSALQMADFACYGIVSQCSCTVVAGEEAGYVGTVEAGAGGSSPPITLFAVRAVSWVRVGW